MKSCPMTSEALLLLNQKGLLSDPGLPRSRIPVSIDSVIGRWFVSLPISNSLLTCPISVPFGGSGKNIKVLVKELADALGAKVDVGTVAAESGLLLYSVIRSMDPLPVELGVVFVSEDLRSAQEVNGFKELHLRCLLSLLLACRVEEFKSLRCQLLSDCLTLRNEISLMQVAVTDATAQLDESSVQDVAQSLSSSKLEEQLLSDGRPP